MKIGHFIVDKVKTGERNLVHLPLMKLIHLTTTPVQALWLKMHVALVEGKICTHAMPYRNSDHAKVTRTELNHCSNISSLVARENEKPGWRNCNFCFTPAAIVCVGIYMRKQMVKERGGNLQWLAVGGSMKFPPAMGHTTLWTE